MDNSTLPRFADVLQKHVRKLQDSLQSLCESIHADISVPYPLSKRLGIDKNLTWKAARILQATSAPQALKHLPGKNGRELFLNAFRRAGAPEQLIQDVAVAVRALEETVQLHTDDRETLELVLDGIPDEQGVLLETSRHLAFRGNSGVWGVQAHARLTTTILTPAARTVGDGQPNRVDRLQVEGFRRFRRLREGTPRAVLYLHSPLDESPPAGALRTEPLDPGAPLSPGLSLLTEFCTAPRPQVSLVPCRGGVVIEMAEGPIGNPGAVDLVIAEQRQACAPAWAPDPGTVLRQRAELDVPVEFLLFDLLMHRDLPPINAVDFELLGHMGHACTSGTLPDEDHALPLQPKVVHLEPHARSLRTDLFPRYGELLTDLTGRIGHDLAAFRVQRIVLKYPPTPTTAVLSYSPPVV